MRTKEKLLSALHLDSGNLFGHIAMEAGYTNGAEWLDQLMEYLQGNVDFLRSYLQEHIPQVKMVEPEATYLIWLDCKELGLRTEKINQLFLNEAKVALNKGITFGKEGDGYMRLNIGCPRSVLKEGLDKIRMALNK